MEWGESLGSAQVLTERHGGESLRGLTWKVTEGLTVRRGGGDSSAEACGSSWGSENGKKSPVEETQGPGRRKTIQTSL